MDAGCTGIVALGSLGETATLTAAEKKAVLETVVKAVGKRGAVVAGIAALSTDDAVALRSRRRPDARGSWCCRPTSTRATGAR